MESTFELSKLDGTVYGKAVRHVCPSLLLSETELGRWPEGFAQAIKKIMGADPVSVPEALQMLTGQEPVKLYDHADPKMVTKDNFYLQILHPTKFQRKPLLLRTIGGWNYAVISATSDRSVWSPYVKA